MLALLRGPYSFIARNLCQLSRRIRKQTEPDRFRRLRVDFLEERRPLAADFSEFLDPHPNGENQFGKSVVALATGNVVITSPLDDAGGENAGAVYLFNGSTRALISTLRGSRANDLLGSAGVTTLKNGNYLISTPFWDNGTVPDVGAVTFGSGLVGVAGVISAANSLIGSTPFDNVGMDGSVHLLGNGNYIVVSSSWNSGQSVDVGAVTFGRSDTGVKGKITAANSLVGTKPNDRIGSGSVTLLADGDYVIGSPFWDRGLVVDVGASTFGNGRSGIVGAVSLANSLVGSTANDRVGDAENTTQLNNGNYVINSPQWDNGAVEDAGSTTFASGRTGIKGTISAGNSILGATAGDGIGSSVTGLKNSNYAIAYPSWDKGGTRNAGAVLVGFGTAGLSGVISTANSLHGSSPNDGVGSSVTALSNGNYVVLSGQWHKGQNTVGAFTFGLGTRGMVGPVSVANSLIGSRADDLLFAYVTVLSDGDYVANSPMWDRGIMVDAGATTYASGTLGVVGIISPTKSLVGLRAYDQISSGGVTPLRNGNYVVASPLWDHGNLTDAGAVTFGNGRSGVTGNVTALNSLVGSTTNDYVGEANVGDGNFGVVPLSNGNYVVRSAAWNNGSIENAGAATFGNGTSGIVGVINANNSLVGTRSGDTVGLGVTPLDNGNYVVNSPLWDGPGRVNVGAVTWGSGLAGVAGGISSLNSLIGSVESNHAGSGGITALTAGNYLVHSPIYSPIPTTVITFANGAVGIRGVISTTNSLFDTREGVVWDCQTDLVNRTFILILLTTSESRVLVGSLDTGFL